MEHQQGNVKVNSKPVALVKFYNIIKSQISSTKLFTLLNEWRFRNLHHPTEISYVADGANLKVPI
jgi:hypothetical protein